MSIMLIYSPKTVYMSHNNFKNREKLVESWCDRVRKSWLI